jgi:hypothetical protein
LAGEGNVKGALLVHLRAHIAEHFGDAAWQRVVRAVPPKDREQLGVLIVTGNWYPVGVWNRALRVHVGTCGADPAGELAEIARRTADNDLHTVFKLTLKLASAEVILRRAGWFWQRYFDTGNVTIAEEGRKDWRLRLEAPNAEDEGASDLVCSYGVAGWLGHALKLAGTARANIQHTRCRFSFSRYCEYRVTW